MPLHIEARQERLITVIRLSGAAGDGDARNLGAKLQQGLEWTENKLIVEVREVDALDSPTALALEQARAAAYANRGWLKLVGAHYSLLACLALNSDERQFEKYDSVDAAMKSADGVDERGVKHFDILQFVKEQEKEADKAP